MIKKIILLPVSIVLIVGFVFGIKKVVHKKEPMVATEDVVLCCNNFSFDLYTQLKGEPGNIFFSPCNISNALSIAYAGARGKTEQQMKTVLCSSLSPDTFFSSSAELANTFYQPQGKKLYELDIANKLFLQDGLGLLPSFGEIVTKQYKAPLGFVDFGNPVRASRTINDWVAEKTREKIKTIVQKEMFSASTRFVIASAIYFKGKWTKPFDKSETREKPFYVDKENKIDVYMMHQKDRFNYMEDDMLQMLEFPYDGGRLSMAIILPREKDGLKMVEGKMNNDMLSDCFSRARKQKVIVDFPRFRMETNYNLKPMLSQMGMPVVFSGDADFSGINGAKDLSISDVVHKAFVKTDEEGSEAAAATAVIIATTSAMRPKIFSFIADHPFMFFIRDKQTGLILFAGRVAKP